VNVKRVHSVLFPSFSDFEDEVSASVFFSGCNLRCYMCYNARVVIDPPSLTLREVLRFVESQIPLCTAVVLLGGEPLVHPSEVLVEFLKEVKSLGLRTKVFTNGTFSEKLEILLPLLDFVSIDIKHRLDLHSYKKVTPRFTQNDLENILSSIRLVRSSGVPYEFRLTAVKPIHTCEDVEYLRAEFPELIIQSYVETDEQMFKKFPLEELRC